LADDIPGAKAKAGIGVGLLLWKTKYRSCPSDHVEIPFLCPFEQVPAEAKIGIWIPDIKLLLSKLSGELTRHVWLDLIGIALTEYQIPGLNVD